MWFACFPIAGTCCTSCLSLSPPFLSNTTVAALDVAVMKMKKKKMLQTLTIVVVISAAAGCCWLWLPRILRVVSIGAPAGSRGTNVGQHPSLLARSSFTWHRGSGSAEGSKESVCRFHAGFGDPGSGG